MKENRRKCVLRQSENLARGCFNERKTQRGSPVICIDQEGCAGQVTPLNSKMIAVGTLKRWSYLSVYNILTIIEEHICRKSRQFYEM